MALMATASAFAVTDGFTYETQNGFTCVNKWIDDRTSNIAGWNALPFAEQYAKARTACIYSGAKDYILVGFSKTMTVDEKSDDFAHLVFINFANGEVERTVQLTCDGNAIKGQLCANNVGVDQFGHVWVCGYIATTFNSETGNSTPLVVYKVDDLESGVCSVAATVALPADEGSDATIGRIDYIDVVGDITLEGDGCTIMAALANSACNVYGWTAEQGATEWTPKMNGGDYVCGVCEETYPADQTSWGTAPVIRIINDGSLGDMFYVDGFTTCPSLYNNECTMIESFANASDLAPAVGTNGVGEFNLGGTDFIAYSVAQYNASPGCQVRVAQLGEGQAFTGMQSYWLVPENGLGEVSDSGTRMHCVNAKVYQDANSKDGAYLLTYKCNNGLGVYAVAQEGWIDPNGEGGVNDITLDENSDAAVEYFNLNGVAVSAKNLTPGLYITRQGNKVAKQIVK